MPRHGKGIRDCAGLENHFAQLNVGVVRGIDHLKVSDIRDAEGRHIRFHIGHRLRRPIGRGIPIVARRIEVPGGIASLGSLIGLKEE